MRRECSVGMQVTRLSTFTSDVFVHQKSRIQRSDDMVFAYIIEQ
jgi:hypothetical protein